MCRIIENLENETLEQEQDNLFIKYIVPYLPTFIIRSIQ